MALRVLELFSGTHSFGKWAEKKGYEVISLDILRTSKATTRAIYWTSTTNNMRSGVLISYGPHRHALNIAKPGRAKSPVTLWAPIKLFKERLKSSTTSSLDDGLSRTRKPVSYASKSS